MSFRWTTTGPWQHSTCLVCDLTYTGSERDLLRWQRGHDKDHDRNAQLVARQARIDAQTCCNTPIFGLHETAATGRLMGQRRTAQRANDWTVLSTPSATHGKEAVGP